MMQEAMALALDFLDEHPVPAVRTLEMHDAAEVALFLQKIPAHYSSLVLGIALPSFAAHLCTFLGAETSARLLLEQDAGRMVSVLRHLEHERVDAILKECPQNRRHTCHLLLRYGLDRVGAWMVPNTAVVTADFSCDEVLNFLKDATEETFSKYVFIINREGVPKGRISYLRLLKAAPDAIVGNIMELGVATISAQLPLDHAAQLPCWEEGDVMPVVGIQQQFIGVLRHVDLRMGLQQQDQSNDFSPLAGEPLLELADAYGTTLITLFDTLACVLESGAEQQQE
jgi:Mg/Co/Ni transporter MgtE